MSKFAAGFWVCLILTIGVVDAVKLYGADPSAAPSTQPAVDPKPVNTKCLVTGDDIDPKVTEVYEGVTYGFCCQDCVKAFNKNPQKYLAK